MTMEDEVRYCPECSNGLMQTSSFKVGTRKYVCAICIECGYATDEARELSEKEELTFHTWLLATDAVLPTN